MLSLTDRRHTARYSTELPVQLLFGGEMHARGVTRDVSASGIFVLVKRKLENYKSLHFLITFPEEVTMSCRLLAFCNGTIVRQEQMGEDVGLAIKIERFQFLHAAE